VFINNYESEHYHMILNNLSNMGIRYKEREKTLEVLPSKLIATRKKFKAQPWPGFPTVLMSPFIVLATQTQGTVLCHDWMYEWRMFFVDDLISMGANIFIADPHRVIVSGPTRLISDRLFCKDIRAGISVILAAMVAEGTSTIENVEVVNRGYEDIENRLKSLGASITKQ
ncbi:MAG: UDP-N-acetylglucosamine 1-carboxyvinyltransferase, partial [Candidatus Woesebacteria bacterium]|nr:UDP-N-acetylglucosamine 1-carboxyvinyltransferase [Candidatus Woesebacteria bacterium]